MLKKIFSYGLVEGIAKGFNKLILLILPLLLNPENYGLVAIVVTFEVLMPFLSLLGLERALLRYFSEKQNLPNFQSTIYRLVITTHFFIFLLWVASISLGVEELFGLKMFPDLILIIFLVFLQGYNYLTLTILRVSENHKKYFSLRLFIYISKFILVILCVIFFKSYLGYLFGACISAILSIVLFKTKYLDNGFKGYSKKTSLVLLTFSWPFIIHGVSTNLLGNVDKLIMQRILLLSDVGQYAFAYSIGSMMMFVFIGVSVYMEPLIYKEKIQVLRDKLLNKFLLITLIASLVSFTILNLMSTYLIPMFFNSDYTNSISLIPLLSVSFLPYPYYLVANYRMIYDKRSVVLAAVSIFTMLVNIGLNIILLPIYGILGAGIATFISYVLQITLFVSLSKHEKRFRELVEVLSYTTLLAIVIFQELSLIYIVLLGALFITSVYFIRQRN